MSDFFKTKLLILSGLLTILLTIKGFQFDKINAIEINFLDCIFTISLVNDILLALLFLSIFSYSFLFIKDGKYRFVKKIGDIFYSSALLIPLLFILLIFLFKLFVPIINQFHLEFLALILFLVFLLIFIKGFIKSSKYIEKVSSLAVNNKLDEKKSEYSGNFSLSYIFFKRTFDIIFSIIMIIYTLPILLITSILIKISSRGPILIAQSKFGLDGKHFKIFKFRTVRTVKVESIGKTFKESENQLTKVGKILSKLFIDEIPIFLNVLKGDLSVIGPRPMSPYKYEYINNQNFKIDFRKIGKPGLISLATLNAKHYNYSLDEYINLDIYYMLNRSAILDISIFLTSSISILINR